MSEFTLSNKLTRPQLFEFPPNLRFERFPESGIMPVPAMLEEHIGTEVTLLLFDKTPFIYEIARLRPFNLLLRRGMVPTRHGPVVFLLFYVLDPAKPSQPFFTLEHLLNPFDRQMLSPWRDLARQTHWHVFLLNAKCEQIDLFEFENVFGLGKSLDQVTDACEMENPGDFDRAKAELLATYTFEDLFSISG